LGAGFGAAAVGSVAFRWRKGTAIVQRHAKHHPGFIVIAMIIAFVLKLYRAKAFAA
jgi:hypothetical protein